MGQREDLLVSISNTVQDYRAGEISSITAEKVNRWICQFQSAVQVSLLRELDYVLQKTYISKKQIVQFLTKLVSSNNITGENPLDYWQKTNFF